MLVKTKWTGDFSLKILTLLLDVYCSLSGMLLKSLTSSKQSTTFNFRETFSYELGKKFPQGPSKVLKEPGMSCEVILTTKY